ncbi:hypothetical protein [Clavibacter tessellarius]|uniref:hypothetical protein n=1 Tax=Clavibacter tessellarius TaxID=31965 RepID=UPI0032536F59
MLSWYCDATSSTTPGCSAISARSASSCSGEQTGFSTSTAASGHRATISRSRSRCVAVGVAMIQTAGSAGAPARSGRSARARRAGRGADPRS